VNIPLIELTLKMGFAGKFIIALLFLLSLVSWAIILTRLSALKKISAANGEFRSKYDKMLHLSDMERLSHKELAAPMGQLARLAAAENRRIIDDARAHTGVKDWSFFLQSQFTMAKEHIDSALTGLIAAFDKGVFILATVSSIAPFVGLLGTV